MLSIRLKKVLDKIVSTSQNAFVEGKHILDATLVANEAVDSRRKQRVPNVLCKLVLEKAYNHVSWSFLDFITAQRGFEKRWRKWIRFFFSFVRYSVLVNANPCGFFWSSRGMREGDPLSSSLFILVMEVLSRMMDKAVTGGFCKEI